MKKNIIIFLLGTLLVFGGAHVVLAQGKGTTTPSDVTKKGTTTPSDVTKKGTTTPSNAGTKTDDPEKLDDPLGEGVSLEGLLLRLFDIILYIGVPVVAFFLIWSGFMFITAQGNPEKLETARSRLLYTIIGAILLLGAWTISQAIKGTIEDIKSGGTALLNKNNLS